jgi:MFS family permease
VLDATPAQIGLLNAAEYLPVLFITLLGGVLADRRRRRPLLFWANAGRALILGVIPILGWQAGLSMPVLYAVAMTAGILTAQFDVTYIAYLPTLVDKRDLVQGNSKLQSSQSVAQVAGQGASGVLVQLLTAPGAIIVDALSFVVSAVTLLLIRTPEPAPAAAER